MTERLEEIKTRFNAMKELESFKKLAPTDLFFDDLNWLLQQAERVEELEKKVQRYEQKFDEIIELGWTENFGGSYVNMGEYHAEAIQIAESAVGRSKRK